MGGYSINPVLDGMLQGVRIAHAIRDQRLEQQRLQLQKQREDRQAQIEDLQTRMGLLQAGKPTTASKAGPEVQGQIQTPGVSGGAVGQPSGDLMQGQPGAMGGIAAGMNVGGGPEAAPIPVDPGRTLNYKGQGYYMPTDAERYQDQLPLLRAQAQSKRDDELSLEYGKKSIDNQFDQVDLPGVGKVPSKAVPFYTSQNTQKNENTRQDKTIKAAADLENTRQSGANSRNAATNANSVKTTAMRVAETKREYDLDNGGGADGATPGQSMLQGRANQRFLKEADDVAQKKAAVDERLDDVSSALTQADGSTYRDARGNELEMNDELRSQLGRKKTMLQSASDAHGRRLKEISDYVHKGEAQPPIPGTAPVNPYRAK